MRMLIFIGHILPSFFTFNVTGQRTRHLVAGTLDPLVGPYFGSIVFTELRSRVRSSGARSKGTFAAMI